MRVELNGEPVQLTDGSTVEDAVAATGPDPRRRGIAVALDGEVVPRGEWEVTTLREGQRLEVLQAVQGG